MRARRGPWRCHTCGLVLTAWAPTERHVDAEHRGGRIECIFTIRPEGRRGQTALAREASRGR